MSDSQGHSQSLRCICQNNPSGKTIYRCDCGLIASPSPVHDSEGDEQATPPPPKKRATENREEANQPASQNPETPTISNKVSVVRIARDTGRDGIAIEHPQKWPLKQKMENLLDTDTFVELMSVDSDDSIVVGEGKINGSQVMVYSHRMMAPGHPNLKNQCKHIKNILNHAVSVKVPLIGIEDFDGVVNKVQKYPEFEDSFLQGDVWLFEAVPYIRLQINSEQVNIKTTHSMQQSDFLFVVGDATHFSSNEENLKFTHRIFHEISDAKLHIRELVDFLSTANNVGESVHPKTWWSNVLSLDLIKSNSNSCDIKCVINGLADNCKFLEIQPQFGNDIVIGFCKMKGTTFAIFGNNPNYLCCSGQKVFKKQETFLGFCYTWKIPLIAILDIPTFLADKESVEQLGTTISKLYNAQRAPKFLIITRQGYEKKDDETVFKMFSSNKTFVWKNMTMVEQANKPLRLPISNSSAASEESNIETIAPNETRKKIEAVMKTIENEKQQAQGSM